MGRVRYRMRYVPIVWAVLAVVVALLALATRGAVLVLVLVAVSVERVAAVVAAVAGWADEFVSGRAGLPPLAGQLRGGAR